MPHLVAALAGRYTLLAALGAGGMATVYDVALKREARAVGEPRAI